MLILNTIETIHYDYYNHNDIITFYDTNLLWGDEHLKCKAYYNKLIDYIKINKFDYIIFEFDDDQHNISKYRQFEEDCEAECIVTINMERKIEDKLNNSVKLDEDIKDKIIDLFTGEGVCLEDRLKLFTLSRQAEKYYRTKTKNNRNLNYLTVRKKLTRNIILSKFYKEVDGVKLYIYGHLEIYVEGNKIMKLVNAKYRKPLVKVKIDLEKRKELNRILEIK